MRDTPDFGFRISHRVDTDPLAVFVGFDAAGLTEINITIEFAQDHDIKAFDNFRPQRGCAGEFVKQIGRTKIGEEAKLFAYLKQGRTGTLATVGKFVKRAAD